MGGDIHTNIVPSRFAFKMIIIVLLTCLSCFARKIKCVVKGLNPPFVSPDLRNSNSWTEIIREPKSKAFAFIWISTNEYRLLLERENITSASMPCCVHVIPCPFFEFYIITCEHIAHGVRVLPTALWTKLICWDQPGQFNLTVNFVYLHDTVKHWVSSRKWTISLQRNPTAMVLSLVCLSDRLYHSYNIDDKSESFNR